MVRLTRLLGGLAAGLSLILATVFVTSVASAESNGGVRVMPLGDSITDGLTVQGGYRINLWQKLVADGYKIDFVGSMFNGPSSLGDHDHEGHSGWRIDQIDANIVNWLRTYTPRTVLLHIGTNDMFQNAAGAPARLGTLLDRITSTAPDTEVFVSTIIPLSGADSAVRMFNAAIPGLVQSRANAGRHVHLVDMYSALTTAGSGTRVQLWDCHTNPNQQWNLNTNGTVTNGANNLCLDANGTANTAGVIIRTCDGRASQRWTRT